MKTLLRTLAFVVLMMPAVSHAHEVEVKDAWARATPGKAVNGAAFLTIENESPHAEKLIKATADVADRVELHTHLMENGVMKMRQVKDIPIPEYGTTALKPGSYHIMLLGLKAPLKEGTTFPLTLTFESAGTKTVTVTVKGVGAMNAGMGGMDHSTMDHSTMDHGAMKHDDKMPMQMK